MIVDYITVLFITLFAFTLVYLFALVYKNNSLADVFWGSGFIVATLSSLIVGGKYGAPQLIITFLVVIWGLRISIRILRRNLGKPEDFRYVEFRRNWGNNVILRSYTDVFLLQGLLCIVVCTPVILVNLKSLNINYYALLIVGLIGWLAGFLFETIGDMQLDQFMKSKHEKGTVLASGLWKYTRHPNYFGESLQWWSIWVIVISFSFGLWWTIIGPITITFLLLKVSGIPMLENKMSKNPKYKDYMAKTNKFIPGNPKV